MGTSRGQFVLRFGACEVGKGGAEVHLDDAEGAIGPELEGRLLSHIPEGGGRQQQDYHRQDQDGQQELRGGHSWCGARRRRNETKKENKRKESG